ncbi:MAG: hypothetical protein U9N54_12930 [candidate division Zixibacteria bacterium]|nr:hypothetical protein [candidate division Zixibacteria bacterium]
MTEQFKAMSCYILAGGKNYQEDFVPTGDLTRLEAGYRRYAKIFEKVKLVIKKDQAKEHYLNYPHVLDKSDRKNFSVGVETALKDAKCDVVFIGSSDLLDFPLEWPVNLIKDYQGESFLGYLIPDKNDNSKKHLFGIYNKKVISDMIADKTNSDIINQLVQSGRLLPVPSNN